MKLVITVKSGYIYAVGNVMNEAGAVRETERVSRLLPANTALRTAFVVLRKVFGDNGRIADWTRKWNCRWMVVVDGKKLGVFETREEALKEELKYVNSFLENM